MNYSHFGKRASAYIVDVLIISLINNIIRLIFDPRWGDLILYESNESNLKVSLPLLFVMLQVLSFGLLESSKFQATPGKILLKIIVTDENGNRISLGKSMVRNFTRIASTIAIFIGYIMFFFSEERQCLHDRIAGTYVLNKSSK